MSSSQPQLVLHLLLQKALKSSPEVQKNLALLLLIIVANLSWFAREDIFFYEDLSQIMEWLCATKNRIGQLEPDAQGPVVAMLCIFFELAGLDVGALKHKVRLPVREEQRNEAALAFIFGIPKVGGDPPAFGKLALLEVVGRLRRSPLWREFSRWGPEGVHDYINTIQDKLLLGKPKHSDKHSENLEVPSQPEHGEKHSEKLEVPSQPGIMGQICSMLVCFGKRRGEYE